MARRVKRKLRRALKKPFPQDWRQHLAEATTWWSALDDGETARMEDLIRIFLADKNFEGARGFDPTPEMRLMVAAQACLLILALDYSYYDDVGSIIISPTVIRQRGPRHLDGGIFTDDPIALAGQAVLHGPVLIVWDSVTNEARHPRRGLNVVFHEFAHKLDMHDGSVDGIPPMSAELARRWAPVIRSVLARLRSGVHDGLDSYGAKNPAELLAVATEAFFETPDRLQTTEPELYALLSKFYQQDPAARTSDLE